MLRSWISGKNHVGDGFAASPQSAAIPYRIVDSRMVFLLVTSRRTGRWIFPKGSVSAGLTPWDSAAKEAFEEAGVTGVIADRAIGSYQTTDKGLAVDVDLYPLCVQNQLDVWQEMNQRLRHWALLAEVRQLVDDRNLASLAMMLDRSFRSQLKQSGSNRRK